MKGETAGLRAASSKMHKRRLLDSGEKRARKKPRMKIHFALLFALESSLVAANLCAKVRLRDTQPYGERVNFNPEQEELPDRTKERLKKTMFERT